MSIENLRLWKRGWGQPLRGRVWTGLEALWAFLGILGAVSGSPRSGALMSWDYVANYALLYLYMPLILYGIRKLWHVPSDYLLWRYSALQAENISIIQCWTELSYDGLQPCNIEPCA